MPAKWGKQAKCALGYKSCVPANNQMILASVLPADGEQLMWVFECDIFQCASNQKKIQVQQLEFLTVVPGTKHLMKSLQLILTSKRNAYL